MFLKTRNICIYLGVSNEIKSKSFKKMEDKPYTRIWLLVNRLLKTRKWWDLQFDVYMKTNYPQYMVYNPKIIKIEKDNIRFQLSKKYANFVVLKKTILSELMTVK
jgi:outer membrane phospholipase A